jgi:phosphorylase superfamily protein
VRIVVPQGAEANAVRSVVPQAAVVAPGAASGASLPAFAVGETAVVLGLCGALSQLSVGDVTIYARVRDNARRFELDGRLVEALQRALPSARVVTACTMRTVITRVEARQALAQRFDAEAVDMEGTHLAAEFAARGVRCAMVRVVSDDASRNLPPIENAIGPDGRLRPLYLALAFARAPRAAVRFVRDVRTALATLADSARTIAAI